MAWSYDGRARSECEEHGSATHCHEWRYVPFVQSDKRCAKTKWRLPLLWFVDGVWSGQYCQSGAGPSACFYERLAGGVVCSHCRIILDEFLDFSFWTFVYSRLAFQYVCTRDFMPVKITTLSNSVKLRHSVRLRHPDIPLKLLPGNTFIEHYCYQIFASRGQCLQYAGTVFATCLLRRALQPL